MSVANEAIDAAYVTEAPPQPVPDEDSAGFWAAMDGGHIALCRCQGCRKWLHPPLERCPACWCDTRYEAIQGTGEVFSFIVVRQPAIPGYRDQLPYVVALIELDEQRGLRLPARLTGIDPVDVAIGQRVRGEIEALPGGPYRVAVFRPA